MSLVADLRGLVEATAMPLPGAGDTPQRHRILFDVARRDLPLARLAEAHWDAVAILREAGREPARDAPYGVWASEIPGTAFRGERDGESVRLTGSKRFCTGAGMLDRALVSVTDPAPLLVEVDLRTEETRLVVSNEEWVTSAFAETNTATVRFEDVVGSIVGEEGFYLRRPGFWHGACGPAACWAGGAAGLLDWARVQKRNDPHTMAHRGAMEALVWGMHAVLAQAGQEIDAAAMDTEHAQRRALRVRHLVERSCAEILDRFGRAYGPHPFAFDRATMQRIAEVQLYIRQCHAERDLEVLGRLLV